MSFTNRCGAYGRPRFAPGREEQVWMISWEMNDLLVYKLETYLGYRRSLNQMIVGMLRCCRASGCSSRLPLRCLNSLTLSSGASVSKVTKKSDDLLLCMKRVENTESLVSQIERKQQHQVVVIWIAPIIYLSSNDPPSPELASKLQWPGSINLDTPSTLFFVVVWRQKCSLWIRTTPSRKWIFLPFQMVAQDGSKVEAILLTRLEGWENDSLLLYCGYAL